MLANEVYCRLCFLSFLISLYILPQCRMCLLSNVNNEAAMFLAISSSELHRCAVTVQIQFVISMNYKYL